MEQIVSFFSDERVLYVLFTGHLVGFCSIVCFVYAETISSNIRLKDLLLVLLFCIFLSPYFYVLGAIAVLVSESIRLIVRAYQFLLDYTVVLINLKQLVSWYDLAMIAVCTEGDQSLPTPAFVSQRQWDKFKMLKEKGLLK